MTIQPDAATEGAAEAGASTAGPHASGETKGPQPLRPGRPPPARPAQDGRTDQIPLPTLHRRLSDAQAVLTAVIVGLRHSLPVRDQVCHRGDLTFSHSVMAEPAAWFTNYLNLPPNPPPLRIVTGSHGAERAGREIQVSLVALLAIGLHCAKCTCIRIAMGREETGVCNCWTMNCASMCVMLPD